MNKLQKISTDLDLVNAIQPTLKAPYETALKFANAIPDYSLLQYRDLAFLICRFLAHKSEMSFEETALHGIINELHEAQLINAAQQDLLHRLRILGNHGAHKAENTRAPQQQPESPSVQQVDQRLIRLREEVGQARAIFLELACDLYRDEYPQRKIPPYEEAPVGEQDHKEILYTAIKDSQNWQAQYEAALTYERLAEEYSNKAGFIKSVQVCVHWISLLNKALASYEAAWKQSAIDKKSDREMAFIEYRNPDNQMAQLCELEPLYQYCRLCFLQLEFNNIDDSDDWTSAAKQSWKFLLKAADRKHPGANTLVGKIYLNGLPGREPQYTLAFRYLNRALKLGAEDVHLQLFQYYQDPGCADFNIDTAFEYLREGEENGSLDCQYELGVQYFHGDNIGRDEELAKAKFEQAASKGHQHAALSLDLCFGDLAEQMEQHFNGELLNYDPPAEPIVNPPKFGRNQPCPCGSGAKYKKCCGGVNRGMDRGIPFLEETLY
ncbi:hypothetical protein AB833_23205 [Chromatiales bacterium (ex Bugula neritina AB1)]|nr:hypothetical protein AB833_23205 [Chromatiales bacterium (ex Bugula neritina AB1)]